MSAELRYWLIMLALLQLRNVDGWQKYAFVMVIGAVGAMFGVIDK